MAIDSHAGSTEHHEALAGRQQAAILREASRTARTVRSDGLHWPVAETPARPPGSIGTARMLTRDDIYTEGLPHGVPSPLLIDFAMRRAGDSILDVGCGFGAYAARLKELGKTAAGLELDADCVAEATARGIDVTRGDATRLPFEDGQFDTAILFEVIEHIPEYEAAVREALRVSRGNVLITVPNVGEYRHLERYGVTYWHLVTTDHVNFFAPQDLLDLARRCGARAQVKRAEPLVPAALLKPRRPLWFALSVLRRLKLVRPVAYRRLYCVMEKQGY